MAITSTSSLEERVATLFLAYLQGTAAAAAGIPQAAGGILFQLSDDYSTITLRPCIAVQVERQPHANVELSRLALHFVVAFESPATTPLAARSWVLAIRRHLCDQTALTAFIDAYDATTRTGWDILNLTVDNDIAQSEDESEQTREYLARLSLSLRVVPGM